MSQLLAGNSDLHLLVIEPTNSAMAISRLAWSKSFEWALLADRGNARPATSGMSWSVGSAIIDIESPDTDRPSSVSIHVFDERRFADSRSNDFCCDLEVDDPYLAAQNVLSWVTGLDDDGTVANPA